MDWKRERDGLAVVVGAVLVLGVLTVGGSVTQFATTLVAAFLGVLIALRVDGRRDSTPGAAAPVAEPDSTTDATDTDAGADRSAKTAADESAAGGRRGGADASEAGTGPVDTGGSDDTDAADGDGDGDDGGRDDA